MAEIKNKNKRYISIITIVFNGEKYIEETINSVISQKNVDVEYIIIDGGSTDRTLEFIEKYRTQIHKVVSEKDNGIYDAINKGIACAKHPLTGIIHCGDTYCPNALSQVYDAFEKTDADVIYGDIDIKEENPNGCIMRKAVADHKLLCKKMSIFHPSCFVKTEVYNKIAKFDTKYHLAADYDFFLKLFLKKRKFIHVPGSLAVFRAGGLSGSNFRLSLKENWVIRIEHLSFLAALYYALSTVVRHYFYYCRKFIVSSIIGETLYFKLKQGR